MGFQKKLIQQKIGKLIVSGCLTKIYPKLSQEDIAYPSVFFLCFSTGSAHLMT